MSEPPVFRFAPAPAYATARDLAALTEGAEIAMIAKLMGKDLMPWQQRVVDTATEYRIENGRRIYRYSTVLVTVPRQSGKTTLTGPVQVHRMVTRPNASVWFTAQTGKDAGTRIRDLIQAVTVSPLAALFTERYANGSEGLTCKGNRSSLRRFSPVEGALHGETPLLVTIDEIWKFSKVKGDGLIGGFSPAQITLHGQAQTWLISTMGTAASGFMNELVERGRAGTDPTMAYFEWSAPDGADPYAPATWWQYHPALGNTITEEALRAETNRVPSLGEWIRAYGNRVTIAEDPIVSPEAWDERAGAMDRPDPSTVGLGYDVAPGNETAAVVVSWRDGEGHPRTRVLHQAPGTAWLVPFVRRIASTWGCTVAADAGGPVVGFTDDLVAGGVDVLTLSSADRGAADMQWLTAAGAQLGGGRPSTPTLTHDGSDAFGTAVANAVLRTTNGVSKVSRDHSTAPVVAIIGSSVALWAHDHRPADPVRQIF